MKKKLIVLSCIIAFLIVIFNKKEIKNIKFYQNINDQVTLNNLYFNKDKKATYYLINIYDEKNNLIDVKKTNTNMINLSNINNLKEKMYIQIISYNNKNRELRKSKRELLEWNIAYIEINDNKVEIKNKLNSNYKILIKKNDVALKEIKENEELNFDNVKLELYQNDILINKVYYSRSNESKIIYPLDQEAILYEDFYIKIETNLDCLLTLKQNKKVVFNNINKCEYLVKKELLKENTNYNLEVKYLNKNSQMILKEEKITFKVKEQEKLLQVYSSNENEVVKDTTIDLKSPNNGEIYYTLDNTIPDENSIKYDQPITIKKDTIITAIAIKNNLKSEVSKIDFKVKEQRPLIYLSPSRQTQNQGVKRAGYRTEMEEMNVLAKVLEKKLKEKNFRVVRAEQEKDLPDRVKESNKLKSDLYIALHTNASTNGYPLEGKARGIDSYISRRESDMLIFANIVQQELMKVYTGPSYRSGVKFGTDFKMMYEIDEKNVNHGILLEIGFHDNYDDALWIINSTEKIADAITSAIIKNFQ